MLGGGQYGHYSTALTVGAQAPSSAEDASAVVLPQDLETIICLGTDPKGWVQLLHSAGTVVIANCLSRPRALLGFAITSLHRRFATDKAA